jgi:predicted nucleic acid binding AN1-type Zn finger protein
MELDAFAAPIYNKKVRFQIKYRRAHIARTLTPYYIVMNDNWVAQYTFSSQIDNINEKNNVPGFRSVDASVMSIMPL